MLKFQMVGFVNKLFLSERKSPILILNSVYPICFPEVLLLSWNSEVAFDRGYSLVEIFSGQGCVSQKWHFICKLWETCQTSNCLTCQHVQHRQFIYVHIYHLVQVEAQFGAPSGIAGLHVFRAKHGFPLSIRFRVTLQHLNSNLIEI